jgi:hypothetical protein
MNASTNPQPGADAALPLISVQDAGDHLRVCPLPAEAGTPHAFDPFRLCIGSTLIDHLVYLAEGIWQRHQRCLGMVLLARLADRRIGFYVPRQRVAWDAASWTLAAPDVPNEDRGIRAIGTLQSRLLGPGEEPIDAVPPLPGVHAVAVIKGPARELWTFLRDTEGTRLISPGLFIAEEREAELAEILPRLEFV